MPALTKQGRAQRTIKTKKLQSQAALPEPSVVKGKQYTVANSEKEFITPIKSQILDLPYTYIAWIGAKYGGKTRPVVTRMIGRMLENKDNYGLSLKKYKTNAAARLHPAIANMALEMRMNNYKVPITARGISNTYLMNSKIRDLNQTVEYASLDDMDGVAGIEAPNLGQFAIVHVEEPVMTGDKIQPSPEEFWETIKILESSVDRSNTRYAEVNKVEPVFPSYHFTMNAWDDHPLITEAQEVFPEDEFLNWCLGIDDWQTMSTEDLDAQWEDMKKSLVENNTAVKAIKSESKAFARLTLFANPGWDKTKLVYNPRLETSKEEQVERFWDLIKTAILKKDYSSLAIYLGLKKQKANDGKTYQTTLLQTTDTLKTIKEEGWEVFGSSQGWDVDINRLFVDTPIVLGRKQSLFEGTKYKLFVLPQKTFTAYGDGGGRNIPAYKDAMVKITEDTTDQLHVLRKGKKSVCGDYLYIDDNQALWLQYFLDDPFHIIGKAKKQGDWSIIKRQIWLNQAINSGFIVIDESNTQLIKEINISVLANGSDKRDESSTLNKNYDRLNSMEYGIWPFAHWIGEYIRTQ